MCAIFGMISRESRKDVALQMLKSMEHRGRDNSEIFEDQCHGKHVVLGHNRLAINDVSSDGNQPMFYEDLVMVVNGEVWNYWELREEYEKRGYNFTSTSDSEIILYLYKENELYRLDGMFSFIIYDRTPDKEKLVVSRDWVGKIPSYISVGSDIIVSSELHSFSRLHKTNAIFVQNNSLITIDVKTQSVSTETDYYFVFSSALTPTIDHDEVGRKTFKLLDNAVKRRMLSDVPIATMNSGGIDSSVMTYLASKYIDNITSYTIKFDEDAEDLQMARLLSERNGIKLVEVEVPKDETLLKERFLECIEVISYPLTVQIEVGILCSFLAERISADGFKVVISGEGSDEAYGSYGNIRHLKDFPDWPDIRKAQIEKQYYGNLLRGNNIFMKYGTIEMRTPFFDREFLDYTLNLTNEYTSGKSDVWKFPLVNAFRGKLPDEILDRDKMAFQKGTNFKEYIEKIILDDPQINWKNHTNILTVVRDHHARIFGTSAKQIKEGIVTTDGGLLRWM